VPTIGEGQKPKEASGNNQVGKIRYTLKMGRLLVGDKFLLIAEIETFDLYNKFRIPRFLVFTLFIQMILLKKCFIPYLPFLLLPLSLPPFHNPLQRYSLPSLHLDVPFFLPKNGIGAFGD